MGQAVSSNNPLQYQFVIPIPTLDMNYHQQLKSKQLDSIKMLRIYTNCDLNDQNLSFQSISCEHFHENAQAESVYYYGQLQNGLRTGLGVQVYENVKSGIKMAFGNFTENKLNGIGLSIYHDDTYYHGEWQDGGCHGFGYYTSKVGDFYLGKWNKGEFVEGIYRTSDFEYIGQVQNGNFHGIGRCYYFDGAIVDGNWSNDQLEGFANHYFPNQDNYVGYYKNSLKHGQGILYEKTEKKIYQGEFFFDQPHGVGKEINKDNSQLVIALFYQGKPFKLYSKQIFEGENKGDTEWLLTDTDQNQKQEKNAGLLIQSEFNFENQIQQIQIEDIIEKKQKLHNDIQTLLSKCEGFKEAHLKLENRLQQLPNLHQWQKWYYEQNQQQFPKHFREQYREFLQQKEQ